MIKKILQTLIHEGKSRGYKQMLLMNLSNLAALVRAKLNTLAHFRQIKSSHFFLQSNSHIEVFHKRSRVIIGKFVFIRKNTSIRVDHNARLVIEDKVFINNNCTINCVSNITIGSYTKIAPNVCINDHDHNYKNPGDEHLLIGDVHIGKHVWIGSNVVILRNTSIGDYSVIAAGSVVKGNIPAHSLYVNKREKEIYPISSLGGSEELKLRGVQ